MKFGKIFVWVILILVGYVIGKMYPNIIKLPMHGAAG